MSFFMRLLTMAALVLSAVLFAGVSGCEKSSAPMGKDVLALVNGKPITVEEYKMVAGSDIPKEYSKKDDILQQMINRTLTAQTAAAEGYISHPEYNSQLEMFYATQLPDLLKRQITSEMTVSDEELQRFKKPDAPVFNVDVIVTDSIEKAEAALAEIKKGSQFVDTAAKYSTVKAQLERRIAPDDDLYPAGVRAVINRLAPGELSPAMKMQMGYMVVRLKSKSTTDKEWDSRKEEFRQQVKDQKAGQAIAALTDKLRAEAVIKIINNPGKAGTAGEMAAEVNGVVIKAPTVEYEKSDDPHKPHRGMTASSLRASLDRWVVNELLSLEARKRGLDKDEAFQKGLKLITDEILSSTYLENVRGTYVVTEGDIQDYYNKHKEKFTKPRQFRLTRILSPTKERAEEAMKLVKSGKDFSAVARELSTDDSTRENGGDVGFVSTENLKSPLKEAISNLKVGKISGILQSDYGFEILKATDIKEPVLIPLPEVSDSIRKSVLLTKQSDKVGDFYKTLRQNASVKVDKELLKSL